MIRPWILALSLFACAESIEDKPLDTEETDNTTETDDTTTETDDTEDPRQEFSLGSLEGPDAAGTYVIRIDATSSENWTWLDLDAMEIRESATPPAEGWSLAFQRMAAKLNGGVSGDGGAQVVTVAGTDTTSVTVPDTGWFTDEADNNDDGAPELAFNTWYDYNVTTHVLTPKELIWVVQTPAGEGWALKIETYYDDAGTSGTWRITATPVELPEIAEEPEPIEFSVSATVAETPIYVDLDSGTVVTTPADPATDLTWDLSLARTTLKLNGGYNGSGEGAAVVVPGTFDEITTAPADGWVEDVEPAGPRADGTALSTWYDYDLGTHTVTAADKVYAIRTADGDYLKLQILTWSEGGTNGNFRLKVAPISAP